MSRVKLTEFRAKSLILGEGYAGVSFGTDFAMGEAPRVSGDAFVVKVDQGVKKRMKQGLVALNVPATDLHDATREWRKKGFTNFIAEPMFPHEASEERYLSLERIREGIRVLYAAEGGIDIEAHPEKVQTLILADVDEAKAAATTLGLPASFLTHLVEVFDANFFSFLELNPLIIRGEEIFLLDAAVLVDSAGVFFVRGAWTEEDIPRARAKHPIEERINELQKTTPASLKLTVLNPDGALFFLLSGGGGSIVIADEAALKGMGSEIGNYGEYSGGPTREETYLYAKEVLELMLASKSSKKALVIAGGVANFTDVSKTFNGIIDAFKEQADALRRAAVKVYVRRGGPNEKMGLLRMREFLEAEGLLGSVHGSDEVITIAVDEAIDAV